MCVSAVTIAMLFSDFFTDITCIGVRTNCVFRLREVQHNSNGRLRSRHWFAVFIARHSLLSYDR